jgi:hypothetical protein
MLALILLLVLGMAELRKDFLGNVIPPECYDLSDIRPTIIETDNVVTWEGGRGANLFGAWTPRYILIKRGLPAYLRERVIEHELCHHKMFLLTGSPNWHKAHP